MNPRLKRGLFGTLRTVLSVARYLIQRDASLLGAGLAFFAMISLAPFIVLAVAIGGAVFGAEAARTELHTRLAEEVGPQVADFISGLAKNAADTKSLSVATLVSLLILLWSSTRLFMEVRRALHAMWQIPPPVELGFRGAVFDYLRARLFAAVGTLIFGALFLALIGSRIALKVASDLVSDGGPLDLPDGLIGLFGLLEPIIALALITSLVMIVYRLLPSRGPRGWPLWAGALATALMLVAGRSLVSAYVSAGAIDTAYGAAGSAVVFLIWAYWSSLGFLFGARLAWALDDLWRRPLAPATAPTTGLAPASEAPQRRDS